MRLNEITYTDAKPVEGYGPGFFRIGGLVIIGGVFTGPTGTYKWNGYDEPEPLLRLVKHIDVLFLGTGAEISHIPEEFSEHFGRGRFRFRCYGLRLCCKDIQRFTQRRTPYCFSHVTYMK